MDELLYEVGLYYDIVVRSSAISGGQMERRDSQLIAVVPGEVSTMSKKAFLGTLQTRGLSVGEKSVITGQSFESQL